MSETTTTASAPPVLPAMRASLRGYWSDARPAQRLAYVAGAVLIAVGLAHGVAWLVVGGSAEGPLSWRKPSTFGVSFGLTLITVAWVSQFLALSERALRATLGVLVVSFVIEVAWVSVQHARGVASHFNDSTALDEAVFVAAGVVVVFALIVIGFYALRSFTSSTASASMTLALRAGLLILFVSMGAGLWMILRGAAFDLEPATVGAAGSIKLIHAVGMHAIQVLPGLAWLASFGSLVERQRHHRVGLAALGYVLLVTHTAVLALLGIGPGSAGLAKATLGAAGVACLLVAGAAVLVSLRSQNPQRAAG